MKVFIQRILMYIDKIHLVLLMKVPWIFSGNNTNAIGLLYGQNGLILITFQFAIIIIINNNNNFQRPVRYSLKC